MSGESLMRTRKNQAQKKLSTFPAAFEYQTFCIENELVFVISFNDVFELFLAFNVYLNINYLVAGVT